MITTIDQFRKLNEGKKQIAHHPKESIDDALGVMLEDDEITEAQYDNAQEVLNKAEDDATMPELLKKLKSIGINGAKLKRAISSDTNESASDNNKANENNSTGKMRIERGGGKYPFHLIVDNQEVDITYDQRMAMEDALNGPPRFPNVRESLSWINEDGSERDYQMEYIQKNHMVPLSELGFEGHDALVAHLGSEEFKDGLVAFVNSNMGFSNMGFRFEVEFMERGNRKYVKYHTDEQTKNMGVFENVLKHYTIDNFSTQEITKTEHNGTEYFTKMLWLGDVHISYEAINGGSNGMNMVWPDNKKSATVFYDLKTRKFIRE